MKNPKGGRPAKDAKDKRKHLVSTRLTDEEYAIFQNKLAETRFAAADFIRDIVLGVEIKPRTTPEEFQLYKNLSKDIREIGNNLNQISRNLNSGVCYVDLEGKIKERLQALFNLVDIYRDLLKS